MNKCHNCQQQYSNHNFNASLYNKDNAPYISPTPGEFPIIAYNPLPNEWNVPSNLIDKVMECRFNAGVYCTSTRAMGDALRASSSAKVGKFKLIIAVPAKSYLDKGDFEGFFEEWERWINIETYIASTQNKEEILFKNSPNLGCWSVIDEPHYNYLTAIKAYYNKLLKTDPNHMFYFNLVGANIEKFCGEDLTNKSYIKYLELIQETMFPPVWSYDLYPIRREYEGKNTDGSITWKDANVLYKQFYEDLEAASKMSSLTNRPFWAFCQSAEYISYRLDQTKNKIPQFWCPAATVPYLRFEAFSALAYGAQGICYWTYWLTPGTETESHPSALIGNDGSQSKAWNAARQVNSEIRALEDVFLGCTLMKVRHTGSNVAINSVTCPLSTEEPIWPLQSMTASGNGVMLSHISNNGNDYLIIVSHDPFNKQKVVFNFNNHWTVDSVNPIEEVKEFTVNRAINTTEWKGTLPEGGYIVFKWNENRLHSDLTPHGMTFPVVALNCFPYHTVNMKPEMVNDLLECGFNAGVFQSSTTAIDSSFSAIGNKNFKLYLKHPSLTSSTNICIDFINRYREKQSLGGWIISEDTEGHLLDNYNIYISLINSLNTGHPVFPIIYGGRSQSTLSPYSYIEYLQAIKEKLNPPIYTFTFAPFRKDSCNSHIETDTFIENLGRIGEEARKSGASFWGTCHCQSKINFDHEFPIPTESTLRFQAFASLAAGANGILFDSYHQTPNNDIQTYILAPMNTDGKKTPVWHYLKNVIADVRFFGMKFKDMEFKCCLHNNTMLPGCTPPPKFNPLVINLSTEISGVIIGYYALGNVIHTLIVNMDVNKFQNISFNILRGYKVRLPSAGSYLTIGTNNRMICSMVPGDYVYFVAEPE